MTPAIGIGLFLKHILPVLPTVVQLVEQAFPAKGGKKTGKKKKQTVMKTVETLAKGAGLVDQLNTISRKVGKAIDEEVEKMNGGPGLK